MAYNPIETRPNLGTDETVFRLIVRPVCWHFDAWLLRDPAGRLYARIRTAAGGKRELSTGEYMIEGKLMRYALAIPADARLITMHDKAEWANEAHLRYVHERYMLPRARAPLPAGFRSRSVALHYVRAPSIPPFDGNEVNWLQSPKNSTAGACSGLTGTDAEQNV